MRNLLWLMAVVVVALLFVLAAKANEDDYSFPYDKASRLEWIDKELAGLKAERACVIRAKNRAQMRPCNR